MQEEKKRERETEEVCLEDAADKLISRRRMLKSGRGLALMGAVLLVVPSLAGCPPSCENCANSCETDGCKGDFCKPNCGNACATSHCGPGLPLTNPQSKNSVLHSK